MSAGHRPLLHLHGTSAVHRLPPQTKLVSACCFVLIVAATPREQFWAFALYAVLLAAVAAIARVPVGHIAPRLLIEVPFVVFALVLPFLSAGARTVEVLGVPLSADGLLDAFTILAKGTLGVLTSILLAATTSVDELLDALERLRLPRLFVLIAAFMIRYMAVVGEELRRMRVAMASRGYRPRTLLQVPALANLAGSLFVRTYERGERVYVAMLSRGYNGARPRTAESGGAAPRQWLGAAALPAAGLVVAGAAWTVRVPL